MKILAAAILTFAALLSSKQDMNPSCQHCSATYIGREEIEAYLKRAPGRAASSARAFTWGSEVYYILEGTATLATGPDIVGWQRRPATNENVRVLNGPGGNGASIRNAATHQLKPGDVIIIPAGVGHWFAKVDGQLRYLMVRIDPDKVTPLKDEAASKADLASGAR